MNRSKSIKESPGSSNDTIPKVFSVVPRTVPPAKYSIQNKRPTLSSIVQQPIPRVLVRPAVSNFKSIDGDSTHPKYVVPMMVLLRPDSHTGTGEKLKMDRIQVPITEPVASDPEWCSARTSCARTTPFNTQRIKNSAYRLNKKRKSVPTIHDRNYQIEIINRDKIPAITNEPLLLHYQTEIKECRREIVELKREIKSYRTKESRLYKNVRGPTLSAVITKQPTDIGISARRRAAKKMREAAGIMFPTYNETEMGELLKKAFPSTFGSVESKLSTEQTYAFEKELHFNSAVMDKVRRFLNQYNCNPFASRRQINNLKDQMKPVNGEQSDEADPGNNGDDESDDEVTHERYERYTEPGNYQNIHGQSIPYQGVHRQPQEFQRHLPQSQNSSTFNNTGYANLSLYDF